MGSDDRRADDEGSSLFRNGSSTDINSRILLIAIISLSVVVVIVTLLHVYARYILRRQARRRAAIHGIGLITRTHSLEPPKRGLEPTVINSLPILVYKDTDHDHGRDNSSLGPECTVCLNVFEAGQMTRVLPNCKHQFHVECIDKWLGSQSSCPICRHEVEPVTVVGSTILPLPREPITRLGGVLPSAPPIEPTRSVTTAIEGTSDESLGKVSVTNSRLSSFRRMISMDRSSRRINSCTQDGVEDLERQ